MWILSIRVFRPLPARRLRIIFGELGQAVLQKMYLPLPRAAGYNHSVMKDINFDLKQLRSFLVVVEHRSFTRASRVLRVGQATVSNHVSALEETLGVELIRRTSREFALTPQGELFREFCERHLEALEALRRDLAGAFAAGVTVVASSTIPSA